MQSFNQGGGDSQLEDLDFLNSGSVVLDCGSYDGKYSSTLNKKYDCNCYGFEPIKSLYEKSLKFENKKVQFLNYGLSSLSGETKISLIDDGSSFYLESGKKEVCQVKNVKEVFDELGLENIDLMKMNVEGSEFDILESLASNGYLGKVDNFIIQFHYYGKNPISRRQSIIEKLSETHEKVFYYPFVWEHWKRKS